MRKKLKREREREREYVQCIMGKEHEAQERRKRVRAMHDNA